LLHLFRSLLYENVASVTPVCGAWKGFDRCIYALQDQQHYEGFQSRSVPARWEKFWL